MLLFVVLGFVREGGVIGGIHHRDAETRRKALNKKEQA